MIKGARERTEDRRGYGSDSVNITQCDLKRTIQISDSAKKYVITPMDPDESPAGPPTPTTANAPATPSVRGGVVTYVSTSIDTGERKEMFGFSARHVKTTMTTSSSPDACYPNKQRFETDGWYIDLNVGLDCHLDRAPMMSSRMPAGGCRDQVKFRREGKGRVGYPLVVTTKIYGEDGRVTFSTTKEVVELSRAPLEAALFDVPAGYTEAASAEELYAAPSMNAMMPQTLMSGRPEVAAAMAQARTAGTVRVGVVEINNKSGRPVSGDALRARLIGQIQGTGFDAIPLNASSQAEAEAEAKAKQCDFILYTDISTLKSPGAKKLGSVFGRVTGVEGMSKTEAKVDFKLFAVGETSPRLQASSTAKEEGDEASAGTAIDVEAARVSAEMHKKGRG